MGKTIVAGLSQSEVLASQQKYGKNDLQVHKTSVWRVAWRQLDNPLLLILAITTLVSYIFHDRINAGIIFGIMALGVGLGLFNEFSSERTVNDLLKRISLSALVIRGGQKQDVPVSEVTVGDVVLLHRGTVIPADLHIIESTELSIDESTLTGESLPINKRVGKGRRSSWAFMGTVVANGSGMGVVQAIGRNTEFGRISKNVTQTREKTAFQKGLAQLGSLMTKVIALMAFIICLLNIGLGRDPLQAVLFALAIAIGLTPALLPVIVTVSMAHGAHRMAKKNVVVKQLVGIEDLGNMEVLCTDKTGTLTDGKINLIEYQDVENKPDPYVLQAAMLCNTATVHHRIVGNPMDVAIWEYAQAHKITVQKSFHKIIEEEFNFEARGQYVVVEQEGERTLIFKGAPDSVLDRCTRFHNYNQVAALRQKFHELNMQGLRLIAVAQRIVEDKEVYSFDDATKLELVGYLAFLDTPKPSAKHAIDTLKNLQVEVKIITGDNEIVTQKVCETIGFAITNIVTGPAIARMSPEELEDAAVVSNVFARVNPGQKQQIIAALKKAGKVVGYMGDGINDAAALHTADVSISVNSAVDVAKDVASVVLLRKGLDVIADGVKEGRRIFANTIKYVLMGTSSNFGNMFSVAGASFFLPFLPMTPSQILLNNSLYDISQLGIPSDEVDDEVMMKPHHWNIKSIYRYMLFFGPISSVFDYASFGLLWFVFHANEHQFQTGWFLESIATQVLVVFLIRTSRSPFFKSRPGKLLMSLCAVVLAIAFVLPFTPIASYLHLTILPALFFTSLVTLTVGYLIVVEFVKSHFLRTAQL